LLFYGGGTTRVSCRKVFQPLEFVVIFAMLI
jgi:hypothetical protein